MRHHRDVIACTLITLGSVIWLGGIGLALVVPVDRAVALVVASLAVAVGAWTAAMVLDDLDVREAAMAGALAVVIGLGLRQLDAREAPAIWMLGPCAIGASVAAVAVWLARKVRRPRGAWLPLAAGLITCGTAVAALVIVAAFEPGSDWRVPATLIGMAGAGGVAYALIPRMRAVHLAGGNCVIVAVGLGGIALREGVGLAIGSGLMGALFGALVGVVGALLGFWARPRSSPPSVVLAKAQVAASGDRR